MVGDGVGADVHAGGHLAVVESLGDDASDGLLRAGQAVPASHGPGRGGRPVAAAETEFAQPASNAGLVAVGADLSVSGEGFLQVVDGVLVVAVSELEDAEIFGRGRFGPRVGVLASRLG